MKLNLDATAEFNGNENRISVGGKFQSQTWAFYDDSIKKTEFIQIGQQIVQISSSPANLQTFIQHSYLIIHSNMCTSFANR